MSPSSEPSELGAVEASKPGFGVWFDGKKDEPSTHRSEIKVLESFDAPPAMETYGISSSRTPARMDRT